MKQPRRIKGDSPLLTTDQVAEIVGLSRTKAAELLNAGIIPSQIDANTGVRVTHRAEVEFWREYGRTEQWRTAMNQAASVLDARELATSFAAALGETVGLTFTAIERKAAA